MYEIFEKLMQDKGVSPYKVSLATGISQASLSDWKKGKYQIKEDKLQKIADYFGVSVEYLKTGRIAEIPAEIDPDSIELVELFQKLNKEQRSSLMTFLRTFAL